MHLRFLIFTLALIIFARSGFTQAGQQPAPARPPITIVTDPSWDVSGQQTKFGEYPLSAEKIASATSTLPGGTRKAVTAAYSDRAKVIAGTVPIWRNRTSEGEWESYQFRKNVPLGADPIRKVTLEVNCDDVARIYINKRLASADKRDGSIKDGYDDRYLFRSVSGFMDNRVYTYDVTDYFFTNIDNTILVEAVSLAFDGSHAYFSAKIVIEFGPKPTPAPKPAPKPAAAPKAKAPAPAATTTQPAAASAPPAATVFEAGRDLEISSLRPGSILELGHVYFKADSYQLDTSSYRTLDALASFLKRHPGLTIEIGGHTNLRPSDSFAADLSANRARAVLRYLTDKGVPPERLTHKGYGKSQPRLQGITKAADRANQRVEVKVLGM
jgi:outer membrane protein OmpA-like peptidoglycan-associated protein